MKKFLIIWTFCIISSISVFCQSEKKWEIVQSLNNIESYQFFIAKYPKGKYVEEAQLKIAQLEFNKAKKQNTITAYEDFVKKTTDNELITEAKLQITKIKEEEADIAKVKKTKSADEIMLFFQKYPQSAFFDEGMTLIKRITEQKSFESAIADGSSSALKKFLMDYPLSIHDGIVHEKISAALFSEVVAIGTDESLIAYIKDSNNPLLIKDAIAKLKTYLVVDNSKVIPWKSLPTVYCGSAESGGKEYLCGIDFRAFSPAINEISHESLLAGPPRFYKPDVASLVFFNWTQFDGYCVKSTNYNNQTYDKKSFYTEALIKEDGLLFESNSIVLKKVNN